VNEPLIRLLLRVFAENSECFLGSLLGLQLAREHVHLQRAGKVQRSSLSDGGLLLAIERA